MNLPRVILSIAATVVLAVAGSLADEATPEFGADDCGARALYQLLHLEGRATDLARLESTLGGPTTEGHSFRDLREVAARFGLELDAVALPKLRSAIRGPALVFLKGDRRGHFVVVRPVGHTGRLLQVLDGERTPLVTDAEWLFASPSWSGLALVPHRSGRLLLASVSVSAACLVALAVRFLGRARLQPFLRVFAAAAGMSWIRSKGSRSPRGASESRLDPNFG